MATAKFYLNHPLKKGTKELRTDEVPIDLMFSLDRKQRFLVTTKERIIPKYWNKKAQEAKTNYKAHIEVNSHLMEIKTQALEVWRKNKNLSLADLRPLISSVITGESTVEKKTVIGALNALIKSYSSEKDRKTSQKFESLLTHLTGYSKKNVLQFESLDFNFYDKFKEYLYNLPAQYVFDDRGIQQFHPDESPKIKFPNLTYAYHKLVKKGTNSYLVVAADDFQLGVDMPVPIMDDTVYKYIINIKIFLSWALKRGYPVIPGYDEWPLIQREYPPISLTMAELKAVETVEINSQSVVDKLGIDKCYLPKKAGIIAEALDNARDYIAMECRTAQRIGDLLSFDPKDVTNLQWTFTQNKGSRLKAKQVTVPFKGYCAPAYWILQKHNFQLPQISNQKLNDNIKPVCKMAGIDQIISIERWAGNKKITISGPKYEFISTHTGRKTFITLGLQLGVPHKIIMELAGITSYRTLKKYEARSEDQVVTEWLETMEDNMLIMRKAQ